MDLETRPSRYGGLGVFTKAPLAAGIEVFDFTQDACWILEEDYLQCQVSEPLLAQSAVRYLGCLFLYNPQLRIEDYLNHSFTPSLLYVLGHCFTRRDIEAGEELTADYRYFLAQSDPLGFRDVETGRWVDGLAIVAGAV